MQVIRAAACTLTLLAMMTPFSALAASILVTTTDDELNDDGDCSLREALESANTNTGLDECNAGNSGLDTITLLVSGAIALESTLFPTEAVSIVGPGRDALTLQAAANSRHWAINMPDNTHDFSIQNLTMTGGDVVDTGGGSILAVQVGTLRLEGVRLSDNRADQLVNVSGGAIALLLPSSNDSRLEIHDSILEDNHAGYRGGAVHIEGLTASSTVAVIDIQRSVFRRNLANGSGGAVHAVGVPDVVIRDSLFEANETNLDFNTGGEFGGAFYWSVSDTLSPFTLIERSSFIDNDSVSSGGALALSGGVTAITNSTFQGNRERTIGGEVFDLRAGADLFLFNSTLTDNGSGNSNDIAIDICDDCELVTTHSIIHSSWQPSVDCNTHSSGVVTSNGHNIDSSGTCTGHPDDLPSTDPQLWPLGDYGDNAAGIVIPTRAPRPDSIVVDAGVANCTGLFGVSLDEDQRGQPRPVPGPGGSTALCDIGATEFQPDDPQPRTVAVTLDGTSTGLVNSTPAGINCPAQDCSAEFPAGSEVTLSASTGPSPGVIFAGWSGDCSGTGDCVLTLTADKTVNATFNVVTDDLFADRFEN